MFACVGLSPVPVAGPACAGDDAVTREQALARLARTFSPRIEWPGPGLVLLDVSGLDRLLGPPHVIGEELRRALGLAGLTGHVAIAGSRTTALLVALGRAGLTVVPCGDEASALRPLPLGHLEGFFRHTGELERGRSRAVDWPGLLATLRRWGLNTLGDVAALPAAEVFERFGTAGLVLQRLARGEDARPLVPAAEALPFEASVDLEWPVEQIEPLSFVLGRLLDPLCARLEREGLAASVLHVRLRLVARDWHVRTLELPAPIRDPRVLRTIVLLDLESHPPGSAVAAGNEGREAPAAAGRGFSPARNISSSRASVPFIGIDRIVIALDPTPGRIVQFSLLERTLPSTEQLSTLLARLGALVGEGRCGAPALADSHRPGAFEMVPFAPDDRREATRCHGREHPLAGARSSELVAPHPHALTLRASALRVGSGLPPARGRSVTSRVAPTAGASAFRIPHSASERSPLPHPRSAFRIPHSASERSPLPHPHSAFRIPHSASERSPLPHPHSAFRIPHSAFEGPITVLRRFRLPVPARVTLERDRPVRVGIDGGGLVDGRVEACAGPWRTSGQWWLTGMRNRERGMRNGEQGRGSCSVAGAWNRDEWDVALSDGAVYRIFRDRERNQWFIDGVVD
jgi:hypothetical protein